MATSEPASRTAPGRFGRPAAWSLVSGTQPSPASSAATDTGRLTKNTERQPQPNRFASVSTPPRTRPTADAKPSDAP